MKTRLPSRDLIISFLLFCSLLSCKRQPLDNQCDLTGTGIMKTVLVKNFLGDGSSFCDIGLSQNPTMKTFSLSSPNTVTVAGTISGTQISISVSYTNLSGLTANFIHDGASVKIGGVTQASGVTTNDFSSPKIYSVVAANGVIKNYTVTVTILSPPSLIATRVYGQSGSFTTANSAPISADSLFNPFTQSLDSNGLYIADQTNGRVLYYPGTSTTATRVYGQNGSFTTANLGGGPTASLFTTNNNVPDVFAVSNGVYICDIGGHRILFFPGTSTAATGVYGQFGNLNWGAQNNNGANGVGTPTPDNLFNPQEFWSDSTGAYIVDVNNHRVLFYPGTSTTATRVYGQSGSFTSGTLNLGGISANSLNAPRGMWVDLDGVYVADANNNRILFYPGTSTTATRVYGQGGSFTTNTANLGGVSATSLNGAWYVRTYAGNVYISDSVNNRVLEFQGTSTTASRVWGQGGNFTTAATGTSATTLNSPYGMEINSTGLYVADWGNNRVLFYSR